MAALKKNLSVVTKHEAFYTGGQIQISKDGRHMFCPCDCKIQVIQIDSGKVVKSFGQEEEQLSCFCLSPDDKHLIIATRMLVFRQWDWEADLLTRSWRAIHTGPISCLTFDRTSTLLASGGTDSTIKVWDIIEQYCTHNFKGHQGVVSVARFRPNPSRLQLVSSADDYKVRVWDLTSSECLAVVNAHFSVITSLVFSPDGRTMYSGGRDSVVGVWDMEKLAVRRTIPVFETVESVMLLQEDGDYSDLDLPSVDCPHVLVAGGKGSLRVFNTLTGRCVHTRNVISVPVGLEDGEGDQVITQAFHCHALNSIVIVTYDNNISFHSDRNLSVMKQLCGSANEVLDVQFVGDQDSHLIVVSNSEKLKVFDVDTWSCQIVEGHTDIILAVDVFPRLGLVATTSKDCSARLWKFIQETGGLACVGVAHGHVQPVGAAAFSRKSASFIVTGGRDSTVKVWSLPGTLDTGEVTELTCQATERAHEKDINSVVVSPNDKFIATASQDKTAKLWKTSTLSLLGVFRGHSRGIWCVQFSPVDQCLATSSTDGSIRVWSLADFSCVKTFEGHDASVLKVIFVSRGMQLLSVGSDGLLKLWTIKTNECVKTFDEHEAKVWSLACSRDEESIVTADADSTIILWKDVSEQEEEETLLQQEQLILQQQELSNLIQEKRYLKAIGLTITLEQPYRLLMILKEIIFDTDGQKKLEQTLSKLRPDQIDAVLCFSQSWNTNSKHCHVTQMVLGVLLQSFSADDISHLPNIKSTIEGLLPYTERHFQRLSRLYQQARFVEYTWQCMRTVTGESSEIGSADVPTSSSVRIDGVGSHKPQTSSESEVSDDAMETPSDSEESKVKKNTAYTQVKDKEDAPGTPVKEKVSRTRKVKVSHKSPHRTEIVETVPDDVESRVPSDKENSGPTVDQAEIAEETPKQKAKRKQVQGRESRRETPKMSKQNNNKSPIQKNLKVSDSVVTSSKTGVKSRRKRKQKQLG